MKRATSDPATRRHRIDPLDTDLLAALEERDRRLYAIVSKATRYRRILSSGCGWRMILNSSEAC